MNLELRDKLKRENVENVEGRENTEPKRRCSLSKISTSEDSDFASKALKIPEVLVHIMKYLPVDDVINCRCVCKLWNECCDATFVIRKFDFPFLNVSALLSNSGCRRMKLEFQDYPLEHIPVNMWEMLSPKIRTLHLHSCNFPKGTLYSIISRCISLENLKICAKHIYSIFSSPDFSFVQLLDDFIKRKERHIRLRALAIRGWQIVNMLELLQKIFTVFPCIVNLSCISETVYYLEDEASRSAYDGTYNLRELRSFTMSSVNDYLWSEYPVVPMQDYQLLRLTKFKTKLRVGHFLKDVKKKGRLFQFFIVQKDLKIIDLELSTSQECVDTYTHQSMDAFIISLVQHILKTCTNLREFRVLIGRKVIMELSDKDFEEFFSRISNLRSLQLSSLSIKDISETTVLPSSLSNLSLTAVQMIADGPYCIPIMKLSPRLKYLNVDVYTDKRLREIIMTLPNLETLILRLDGCTNYGFIGEDEKSSIRSLQKLEYLQIVNRGTTITKKVFDEFRFPCLKYLGLSLHCRNRLPETFSNIPAIRTLQIHFTSSRKFPWRTESVSKLCESLRNLEHLIVDDLVLRNRSAVNIFNSHSKLRFITACNEKRMILLHRISGKQMFSFMRDYEFLENDDFSCCRRDIGLGPECGGNTGRMVV